MGLKEIREEKGLSRKALSDLTGVSLRSLQDYEQGHKKIAKAKSETLYRLSLALGCSMENLLEEALLEDAIPSTNAAPAQQLLQQMHAVTAEPSHLTPSLKFQHAYRLDSGITQKQIESQKIFCSKYQIYGRWKLTASHCVLLFLYNGILVKLLFDVFFSENTLPWLVDAAEMKMESYIDNVISGQ